MALKKKVGPAGGPVAPRPLRPNVNKQVIKPHVVISTPGSAARIAADNGAPNKKPTGHRPGAGQDRPS